MKKFLSLFSAGILLISLCACAPKAQKAEAPASEPAAAVVNPMQECGSLEELNEIVGGRMVHPGVMGVSDEHFNVIDNGEYKIAQYDFSVNGTEYSLRFSYQFEQDISGVYTENGTAFDKPYSGEMEYVKTDDMQLARWYNIDGQYILSVRDGQMPREQFLGLAEEMEDLTNPAPSAADNEAYYASLAGEYQDSVSQRAVATVEANGSESMTFIVRWSNSAMEANRWTMHPTRGEDGLLNYSDCLFETVTTDENGAETVVVNEENGSGFFSENEGKLYWTGAADENCAQCIFEKIPG